MTTYGLVETAGGVALGYALTVQPYDNGDGVVNRIRHQDYKGALTLANPINWIMPTKYGGGFANNKRSTALIGGAAVVGGRIARKLPIVKSLRNFKLKVDKHVTVRAI